METVNVHDNVVEDIWSYMYQQMGNRQDFSVYELMSALSTVEVFNIFKKHDYAMWYGSDMYDVTKGAISAWIDKNNSLFRDELPDNFPYDEDEVKMLVNENWDDDIWDMYFSMDEFAEDVQTICDNEFEEYRR